ncbi:MAG: hypothetical protein PHV99_02005 [Candidatus Pacebacteria bacterium]|nr:hypothetical protein [Candidatus Paceibacterota bacterium]
MKIDTRTILLIITTFLVAAAAYWFFFTGTGNEPPVAPVAGSENQAQIQFQSLVSTLTPISFDTKIFSDPRFVMLVDLATPIMPESAGRVDPFALVNVSEK